MKLARYRSARDGSTWVGARHATSSSRRSRPATVAAGPGRAPRGRDGPPGACPPRWGSPSRSTACTCSSPVPEPPSIRDFYAFEAHVATARRSRGLDMEPDWYDLPVFYFTNPAAVLGPDDDGAGAAGDAASSTTSSRWPR